MLTTAPRVNDTNGTCVELDCIADLLRSLPPSRRFAIDAGAHRGVFSRALVELDFRVLAVEANPTIADQYAANLSREIANGRVTLARCAVSDRDGSADFILGSASTVNTLEPIWTELGFPEEFQNPRKIQVEVRRLDRLCREHDFSNIGLLKIDVEGHELPALQGFFAGNRIRPPAIVMFEAFSKFPEQAEACVAYLDAQGYDTMDLFIRVGPETTAVQRFHGSELPPAWTRDGSLFYANVLAYHPSVVDAATLPTQAQLQEQLNLDHAFVR